MLDRRAAEFVNTRDKKMSVQLAADCASLGGLK